MSIQNLIDKSNQYKNTSWFNKDKFWSNLWSKLASAYSNLNYVMASNIIKAIEKGGDDLKLDTEVYAEGFAQLLVDKKVGVAALVSVMRKGNLSFSGKNFYKLLDTLHKGYVKAPGLFTEEIMARMEYVKALPFVGNNNLSDEEKEYIQNLETPLELVDMLIQKPENMTFVAYKDFIESSLTHIRYDNNAAESRKTEVILLGLKNLMNYENIYTDRVEVQQPADLNVLNIQDPADQIIEGKQSKIITEIEDWIGDEDDISKKTALANKLFHALKSADLIGTSYEKQVVDYVKTETNVSKQDKVMQYAIYEARKAAKTAIQTSAEALRTSLIGVAAQNQNLPKLKLDNFKKDGKDIAVKKLFEKAANSGRLQREVKRYVMKQLGEKKKLTDAATTISGHENVQKMAVMF